MKGKDLNKVEEKLFKIFIILIFSILCLAMFYASIKLTYNYFTKTDEQICQSANSNLINGKCHYELDTSVKDKRNMLLIGGIACPIFAILIIFYLFVLIKYKFKGKK